MKRTEVSHFSHVLGAVQRTGRLPGGSVRGLPNGRSVDGLHGFHSFALEISEAQREWQLGRARSAHERIKQLEFQFNGIAGRWDSSVSSLISDIRQGKQLKNLEKLKELKAAQIKMQQLISNARKAFQDLVTALDHDAIAKVRESGGGQPETRFVASQDPSVSPADSRPTEVSRDLTPDAKELGSFAANYRCGAKLQLASNEHEGFRIVPELEAGKFYYLAGLKPPRVIRIRELRREVILVFDTIQLHEATLTTNELADFVRKGIWVLVHDD